MGGLTERVASAPSVQNLGAMIPIGDDIIHVAHEDRIMRQIEQLGLFL